MQVLQPQLAAGYNAAASTYDQQVGLAYAQQIGRLLDHIALPPQPAILDVGTGTGIALFEALRRWPAVHAAVGVDIAPGMLQQAQLKALQAGIPAVFLQASAEQLPFPTGSFDLVMSNASFHWFPDRLRAMREMARVLKPGGLLVLQCALQPSCQELLQLMGQVLPAVTGRPLTDIVRLMPSRAEVERCTHLNGLKPLWLQDYTWQTPISQPASFLQAISTAMPHWRADLSPQELSLVDLLLHQVLESAVPRGGLPLTWAAVELIATKVA